MPFSATTLTLCICFLTAISRVLLKLGFEKSNPLTGMVVSVVIGCLMLDSAALIFSNPNDYSWNGVLFFAGIGIVAPPVVRYLTYLGVHTLGAARSDPVRSLTPFFAILFCAALNPIPLLMFNFFAKNTFKIYFFS